MRKLLKVLYILQSHKETKKRRINPYNPLSYLAIVIMFIFGVLMFGFVGIWGEVATTNPFKWQ